MHPVDLVAGEAVEQALGDHPARAAQALLGGLEDEDDRAVEIAALREIARGAQQHRGVPVMAAGMHSPRMRGRVGHARRLLDGKRVHVGAQADAAVAAPRSADQADDAGAALPLVHLVHAVIAQVLGHDPRGPGLLEAELGMGVNVAADRRQILGEGLDGWNDAHAVAPSGTGIRPCGRKLAKSQSRPGAASIRERV